MTLNDFIWEVFSIVFVVAFVVIISLIYKKWMHKKIEE